MWLHRQLLLVLGQAVHLLMLLLGGRGEGVLPLLEQLLLMELLQLLQLLLLEPLL